MAKTKLDNLEKAVEISKGAQGLTRKQRLENGDLNQKASVIPNKKHQPNKKHGKNELKKEIDE